MWILWIGLVSSVAFVICAREGYDGWGGLALVLCVISVFAGLGALIQQASYGPWAREAQELRLAVEALECTASEDVIGSAVAMNRGIVNARAWNQRWIADPFIPDDLDTVSVITIPRCR